MNAKNLKVVNEDGSPTDPGACYLILRIDRDNPDEDDMVACRRAAVTYCDSIQELNRVGKAAPLAEFATKLRDLLL